MSKKPPERDGTAPVITPARVVVALCLTVPWVAMLWVDSYARVEPTLIGIPFFFWYQLLWVLLSGVFLAIAYVLVRRDRRTRRGGGQR